MVPNTPVKEIFVDDWRAYRVVDSWLRLKLPVQWALDSFPRTWADLHSKHKLWRYHDDPCWYRINKEALMTFDEFYRKALRQAQAYKNHKRGSKWNNAYWLRFKAGSTDTMEFLYYPGHWQHHGPNQERIPAGMRCAIVVATLDPAGFTLDNREQHERIIVQPTPEAAAAIPGLEPYTRRTVTADTTYNNLLATFGPMFWHGGNGKPEEPGYSWYRRPATPYGNIVGPVRYDAKTDNLTPVWEQKTRVVDKAARLAAQREIRAAFSHLKMLKAMNVVIDPNEAAQAVVADPTDGRKFLDLATGFAPTNHGQVLELVVRATAIHYGRDNRHPWYLGHCPLLTGRGLTRFRRKLYHASGIIDYV